MASRLRGMVILSSTVIPRAQRLLETGVVQERPVWLDVVEAYPPIPPPPVPPTLRKGKYPHIVYPGDEEVSMLFTPKVKGLPFHVTSLFESHSMVKIKTWDSDRFCDVSKEDSEELKLQEKIEKEQDARNMEMPVNTKEKEFKDLLIPPKITSGTQHVLEEEDAAPIKLDKSLLELADLLKELEKK